MAGNENSGKKPLLEVHPQILEQLCKFIRAGNYIKVSCDYVGIDNSTYHRYWRIGEEQKEQGITEEESIYVKFYNSIKKARAEAEIRNVSVINNASKEDWKASAWWLERSFPDRYGRRMIDINQKVEGSMNHQHEVEGVIEYDEEAKELLEKLFWKERELTAGIEPDTD